VSTVRLRAVQPAQEPRPSSVEPEWVDWLRGRLDLSWRPGEWDPGSLLFTGGLSNDRTAVWPCRTPGCDAATRRQYGRCESCRRARGLSAVNWEDFCRRARFGETGVDLLTAEHSRAAGPLDLPAHPWVAALPFRQQLG
jgi:hypothetical protein